MKTPRTHLVLAWLLLQGVVATSARADWPAGGLKLATGVSSLEAYPDGIGGAIVFAPEQFATTTPHHAFTRVLPDGFVPDGWPTTAIEFGDGFLDYQIDSGANILYIDQADATTLRVRRVLVNGRPDERWPSAGRLIVSPYRIDPKTSGGGFDELTVVSFATLPDGAGGTYLAWCTHANGPELRVTRVLENGSFAPGWTSNGLALALPAVDRDFGTNLEPITLASDGLHVDGQEWDGPYFADYVGMYYNRRDFHAVFDPSGATSGLLVRMSKDSGIAAAQETGTDLQEVPDGQGGVLRFWLLQGVLLRGQHLRSDGSPAPGWPATGATTIIQSNRGISRLRAVSDRRGGALLVWEDFRNATAGHPDVYALGIDGAGKPTLGVQPPQGLRATRLTAGPVPSGDAVTLALSVPAHGRGRLDVFDACGRLVRTLYDGEFDPGEHALAWDGRDEAGRLSPPGLYLARANVAGIEVGARIVRVR